MSDLFSPAVEKIVQRPAGMAAQLSELYDNPSDVVQWFLSPQLMLEGQRPVDLMQSDNGWMQVHAEIQRLRDSSYV